MYHINARSIEEIVGLGVGKGSSQELSILSAQFFKPKSDFKNKVD